MSKHPGIETDPSTLPSMDRAEVVEYCARLGIPGITDRYVKWQTIDGRLAVHRIGVKNFYSEVDVLSWVASMRRVGTGGEAA